MLKSNQKGVELSITAIVVIAVGLVVLLVVLAYFVGGFGRSGGALKDVTVEAEKTTGTEVGTGISNVGDMWKKDNGETCRSGYECLSDTCEDPNPADADMTKKCVA